MAGLLFLGVLPQIAGGLGEVVRLAEVPPIEFVRVEGENLFSVGG